MAIKAQFFNNRKGFGSTSAIRQAIEQALNVSAESVKGKFDQTTATWKGSPKAEIERGTAERIIGVDDPRWGYVVNGTRPRIIQARSGGSLRFQTGYNRKTTPRSFGSRGGGPFGDVVYAKQVRHPGIQAGEQNVLAAEIEQPVLTRSVQNRINAIVK